MKKTYVITISLSFTLFIISLIKLRGTFGHFLLSNGPSLPIYLPTIILFILYNLYRKIKLKKSFFTKINHIFLNIFIVFTLNFLSYYPGMIIGKNDIDKTKIFCEKLIPKIEQYKIEKGTYPYKINDVSNYIEPPFYIRRILGNQYYSHTTNYYRFDFMDPRGIMTIWGYDKEKMKWYTYD